MIRALSVRGGELVGACSWVYAWLAHDGVVYVGGTGLHPETRTWLHLHDDDPEVGRLRARYPTLKDEALEVVFMRLDDEVDRQRVRHGAVRALAARGLLSPRHVCDSPPALDVPTEVEPFVARVAAHLRGGG